jgi:hypothetical protein
MRASGGNRDSFVQALAFTGFVFVILGQPARPQSLVENSIVITGTNGLDVLSPEGEIVKKLDVAGVEPFFLYNGHILVADAMGLAEIDLDTGQEVRHVDLPTVPATGIALGAGGLHYVITRTATYVLDTTAEEIEIVEKLDIGGVDITTLPNGNVMAAVVPPIFTDGGFEGLREVDPATATVLREYPVEGITGFARDAVLGEFWVIAEARANFPDRVQRVSLIPPTPVIWETVTTGTPSFASALANGQLGVVIEGVAGIQVYDAFTGDLLYVIHNVEATGFAVKPFTMEAEITGTLLEPQGELIPGAQVLSQSPKTSLREAATFVYSPGSGIFTLLFDPLGIIAPMFDAGIVSFFGFDYSNTSSDKRGLVGFQVSATGKGEHASFAASVTGDHVPVFNFFRPEEVEGTLHAVYRGGFVFDEFKAKANGR